MGSRDLRWTKIVGPQCKIIHKEVGCLTEVEKGLLGDMGVSL